MELVVRNVNQAFSEIFWKLKVLNLQPEQTRNRVPRDGDYGI
jgi:hypothetical protein